MSDEGKDRSVIGGQSVAKLARGVRLKEDKVREQTLLLAPERTIGLDAVGVAVLTRLDGDITLDALVDQLAEAYNAPRDVIEKDVLVFLQDLADRRLLEIKG